MSVIRIPREQAGMPIVDIVDRARAQTKGDVPGHEFHGNQWTGGIGGAAFDWEDPKTGDWRRVMAAVPRAKVDPSDWAYGKGPSAAKLAAIARVWTGGATNDAVLRAYLLHSAPPPLDARRSSMTAEQAQQLAPALGEALDHAPPIDEALHRGFVVDSFDRKPGDVLRLGPSSFSTDPTIADDYTKLAGGYGTPVHLEVAPGAFAVPLFGLAAHPATSEVISGGQLEITSVDRRESGVYVKARQIPTVGAA